MKIIAVIPARYNAKRFPGKLLKKLGNKTIIEQTYLNTYRTELFDDVYVVTDNKKIYSLIKSIGGKPIMSEKEFESGTDRIASAVSDIDVDIIINVQGDEPFIDKDSLSSLINSLIIDMKHEVSLASLMTKISDPKKIFDQNIVKVIVDNKNFAVYFSRFGLPFKRDNPENINYYRHIGIYAFRKQSLLEFSSQKVGPLERSERIECLRFIENRKKIKMVTTLFKGVSIDTPDDLSIAKSIWKSNE